MGVNGKSRDRAGSNKSERGLVVFHLAGQDYGVDVDVVQEVLTSADILPVVDVPPFVVGVLKLRGASVPVIDLRKRFNLPGIPWTYETCILVLRHEDALHGLLVDSVSELLSMKKVRVEAAPDMVSGPRAVFFEGAAHLDDRFLLVLNTARLLQVDKGEALGGDSLVLDSSPQAEGRVRRLGHDTHLARFLAEEREGEEEDRGLLAPAEDMVALGKKAFSLRKIVAFDLGDELYGADIGDVAEILEPLPVRPIPNVPDHVLGLVNLRGSILPLVDLRVRFRLAREKGLGPEGRIILLRHRGMLLGLVVDRMWELLRLAPESFQPPPEASGIKVEYVKEVGRVRERLLMVLNVGKLVLETSPNRARASGVRE